jgi:hypothetical protein
MSAYILSDKHFQIIAQYVAHNTGIQAQIIADKLKRINIESVDFRYNEKTRFSKVKFNISTDISNYSKFDIIQLVKCWGYQSCENAQSLDFLMMDAYLLSYFDEDEIRNSNLMSIIWSI